MFFDEKKYFRLLLVVFGIYYIFSQYYYTQKHLFDPYLQSHTPRLDNDSDNNSNLCDKNEKIFKILALGGSTTQNANLPKEKRYVNILSQILQTKYPGIKIKVFCGANEWYITKHSLINYVTYYRYWNPDLVILMHAINDLCRSFSLSYFAVGDYNDLWTHFYGPSIRGANPMTFEEHLMWEFFTKRFRKQFLKFKDKAVNFSLEKYVSIKMFERNFKELTEYIKYDGAQILLVSQPYLFKPLMSDEELKVLWIGPACCNIRYNFFRRQYASAESLSKAMELFNETTRKIAFSDGVVFVNAADYIDKNIENFIDDVHYTPQGSELLARIVAKRIIQSGIIREKLEE